MARQTLGVRLNNPGNIEKSKDSWQGLVAKLLQKHPRFFTFINAVYGIRAIARILITYQDKRKARDGSEIDTVREMIERWAPPEENDTNSYVAHVRQRLGLNGDEYPDEINVHDYDDARELVVAIIKHENAGYEYPDSVIDEGLRLAGIQPPIKALRNERDVQGNGVALTGAILVGGAELIRASEPALPLLQTIAEKAPFVLTVGIVAALAYVLAIKFMDRRKGVQ